MGEPTFWDDPDQAQKITQELNGVKAGVDKYKNILHKFEEMQILWEMGMEDKDETVCDDVEAEIKEINEAIEQLELELLLSGKYDANNAILTLHAGAGGTEAQDWTQMLLRMYGRWAERNGFSVETADLLPGDEAGVKSVTLLIKGHNAYGYLKSEKGVHRLVRISPFDANSRRHTSFSACDVMPEIDDDVEVDINMADVRVDTYRASGAGGQHINKTDSAVRITHLPTGIVATSQDGRSQHDNRDKAMKALVARVYDYFQSQQTEAIDSERKSKVGTGDRAEKIRTYNYPQNRVTDHRIGLTIQQLDRIIEGKLDDIITALINEDQRLKLEGQK